MPPDTSDRERLLEGLDRAEAVVVRVYRWVLVALVAFVGWIAMRVLGDLPAGFGTQGEWFYLTVVLMLFAGWVLSQFVAIGQRGRTAQTRRESRKVGSHGRSFTLRVDGGAAPSDPDVKTTTVSWSASASSLADEDKLNDEEIARAAVLLGVHDLDQVCRSINPRYATWDESRQDVYRQYVQGMADARRA